MAKGHRRTWVQSHLGMLVVLLLRQRIPEDFCQDGFREKGWSFSSTEREYLHLASSITVHGLKVGPHKSYIYIYMFCVTFVSVKMLATEKKKSHASFTSRFLSRSQNIPKWGQLLDVDALRHQHLLVRNTANATRLSCEASVCHPTKIAFNKMSRAPEDLN